MILMMGTWLNKDLGGFEWDGSSKQFNLHTLSMVYGLIVLYGEFVHLQLEEIVTAAEHCLLNKLHCCQVSKVNT